MSTAYEQVQVDTLEQWRHWLATHGTQSPGVWLITWKKGHGPYLAYDEIVDEALCHGWVDSQPRRVDPDRSSRLLTPRRAGSSWSRVNKQRVQRLIDAGQMTPAGLAVVADAQRDRSWNALDDVEDLNEPAELTAALDDVPAARDHWNAFPRSARRAILEWIDTARTQPTRVHRIDQTVAEATVGRRANQWRQNKTV